MARSSRSVHLNTSALVKLRGPRSQADFVDFLLAANRARTDQKRVRVNALNLRTLQRAERGEAIDRATLRFIADAGGVSYESLLADNQLDMRRIDLSRLPTPASRLFGRELEMRRMSNAVSDRNVSVVAIIGFGGIGKSALTHEWLNRARPDYFDVSQVFGWSFYDQGTHSPETDSRIFFEAALAFLGFSGVMPNTETEKGRRLAELLKDKPTLLVLDGIEPLQDRPDVTRGYLRDPGLRAFFDAIMSSERLRKTHKSFVLVTSRQPLAELSSFRKDDFESVELKSLSSTVGARLLRELGVQAITGVREELAEQFGGHPLALVLLGRLLSVDYEQRAALVQSIPLFADPKDGGHAKRVMRAYEKFWTPKAPQNIFLRLLGLFDRPVTHTEIEVLLDGLTNLTRPLKVLSEDNWQAMESSLKHAGLLSEIIIEGRKGWDTHPIVRAYFGQQFCQERPALWRRGHSILRKHFEAIPDKQLPTTLAEMEPLYRAVHHGCLAQEFAHSWREILDPRILRGAQGYSAKVLGAISANLAALSRFFPNGDWSQPATKGLAKIDIAWILAHTSFSLFSLLRLSEMLIPLRIQERMFAELRRWDVVVDVALEIVDAELLRGQPESAISEALKGITCAQRIPRSSQNYASRNGVMRAQLGAALHQAGRFMESRTVYQEAEQIQGRQLFSIRAYRYCMLLIEMMESQDCLTAVEHRAETELIEGASNVLRVTAGHLISARCYMANGQLELALIEAEHAMDSSAKGSRDVYTLDALLLRADARRQLALKTGLRRNSTNEALHDVRSVIETARRFDLPTYLADAYLLESHLQLDIGGEPANSLAVRSFRRFVTLVNRHSYGRRYVDRELLRARVHHRSGETARATRAINKARWLIHRDGQMGMLKAVGRIERELRRR